MLPHYPLITDTIAVHGEEGDGVFDSWYSFFDMA